MRDMSCGPRNVFRSVAARMWLAVPLAMPLAVAQAAPTEFQVGICVTANYPDSPVCTTHTDTGPVSIASNGASSSVSGAHRGTLESSLQAGGGPDLLKTYASLRYSFEMVATDPAAPADALVPLHVQAHGWARMDGDPMYVGGAAQAIFFFQGPDGVISQTSVLNTASLSNDVSSFDVDRWAQVRPGTFSVYMATTVEYSSEIQNAGASGSSFVDPLFTIDPAYAGRYQLVGLPGTDGPMPPVPEPATSALALGGLAVLAAVQRRRRRAAGSLGG